MNETDDDDLTLKERVLAYIRRNDYVTFAELSLRFDAFRDGEFALSAHENHILWVNMTKEAVDAIEELREEGLIVAMPSQLLTYLVDGMMLKFPIAKRATPYKKPHWHPVSWRPAERLSAKDRRLINKARQDAGRGPVQEAAP